MYSKILMIHGNQFKDPQGSRRTRVVNLRFIEFAWLLICFLSACLLGSCQSIRQLYVYDRMLFFISEALILFLLLSNTTFLIFSNE